MAIVRRSYSFHTSHLRPLHRHVTLCCGMAVSSHPGKIPQNLDDSLFCDMRLWLSCMSAVTLSLVMKVVVVCNVCLRNTDLREHRDDP